MLSFLRSKGIVHRDLKPGNFLFSESWHLVLADFGTAKEVKAHNDEKGIITATLSSGGLMRQSSANNLLKGAPKNDELFKELDKDGEGEARGSFVGTEDYVAPEVIKSEHSSFSADLWSLGVIVFQLITGKTPFKGNTEYTTFENILACQY